LPEESQSYLTIATVSSPSKPKHIAMGAIEPPTSRWQGEHNNTLSRGFSEN
jgi:hypothetical protein